MLLMRILLCCYTANPDEETEGALLLLTTPDLVKVGSFISQQYCTSHHRRYFLFVDWLFLMIFKCV